MDSSSLKKTLDFLKFSERLKVEKRNSFTTSGEKESVASHSWRVALLVLLFNNHLDTKIDTLKALKMALIHDIAEAEVGDIPYHIYEQSKESLNTKLTKETAAMQTIKSKLPNSLGSEVFELWQEFEQSKSVEAKFVQALDKIEAQIQDNEIDFKHWTNYDIKSSSTRLNKYCHHDSFLTEFRKIIQQSSKEKIEKTKLNSPN